MRRVKGMGPVPADIMIVGEGPGREEAETGEPFSGPTRPYIDHLVSALAPATVYITNAVQRVRWWQGRVVRPGPFEAFADRGLLAGEIRRVQPRLFLALGRLAEMALKGLGHGERTLYVPHPAYIRRYRGPKTWSVIVESTAAEARKRL